MKIQSWPGKCCPVPGPLRDRDQVHSGSRYNGCHDRTSIADQHLFVGWSVRRARGSIDLRGCCSADTGECYFQKRAALPPWSIAGWSLQKERSLPYFPAWWHLSLQALPRALHSQERSAFQPVHPAWSPVMRWSPDEAGPKAFRSMTRRDKWRGCDLVSWR